MDRPWTPELVEERLVEAFRELPNEPVYSARANVFEGVVSGRRMSGMDLIGATARLLQREDEERLALLTWARSKAVPASLNVSEFCDGKGWSRATFEARRRRAAKIVSDGINAVRLLQPSGAG